MSAASADSSVLSRPGMDWDPGHSPWLIALAVPLATFMEVLDTTIVNVALPHVAGNLSASVDESTWVLTSYLVSNAIVLPLSGWLSTMFGRKRFYMSCVTLFTISSVLCGFAPSLSWLVFFRILQGLGGGGLQPSAQAILIDTFPRERRGMGMAVYGIAVVVAPILGPTLGGWITDSYSWRWVFFINVPVGILSLLLTWRLVHDPPYLAQHRKRNGGRIDYVGLSLIVLGIGSLQLVLDKGEREDWLDSRFIIVFSILAAAGILAAIFWELRHREPLVELRLLKDRNFAAATFLMFMVGFALFGSTLLLPLFLQTLMGYTAMQSGMTISPGGMVTFLMMPVVGLLISRFDARLLIALGLAAVAYGLYYSSGFNLNIDFATAVKSRMIMGFGLAFLFVPINTAAYAFLPVEKNNNAAGIINLARNLGGSCGIAFIATLLARRAQVHQNTLVEHMTPYDPEYQRALAGVTQTLIDHGHGGFDVTARGTALLYRQMQRHAMMLSYVDLFAIACAVCLLMIPAVLVMRRRAPHRAKAPAH